MNEKKIQTFLIQFKNEIAQYEIPLFRGAIIESLPEKADILFHNHTDNDGFRYQYPYIQYKRIKGKAAIFCICDGVDAIGDFFSNRPQKIMLGDRAITTDIECITPKRTLLQAWNTSFTYSIRNWIPLNSDNYKEYIKIEGLVERIKFLERIMTGNLLSFAKGVKISIESPISCEILELDEPKIVKVKSIKLMAFDARFKTNIYLPNFVGLGKHVSIGFGSVNQIKTSEQ